MIVAPFYKKLETSDNHEIEKRIERINWVDNILMMKNSFYKFNHRSYKFVMQTDLHTAIQGVATHRTDHGDLNLMASIVRSNTDFVLSHCDKMVLVGADHLIVGDVADFFREEFDIGLFINVTRDSINNTVILVNKNEENGGLVDEFFIQREKTYNELDLDTRQWGGDQKSITLLLEKNRIISEYMNTNRRDFLLNGLKIKLYEYNVHFLYAVNSENHKEFTKNMLILDFKSLLRKTYIKKTYENLLKTL